MTSTITLYLAGPITGHPGYEAAFADAETLLADAGYRVISPTRHEPYRAPAQTPISADSPAAWQDWMRPALVSLTRCDGVALLPGWEGSAGASWERRIAQQVLRIPALTVDEWVDGAEGLL